MVEAGAGGRRTGLRLLNRYLSAMQAFSADRLAELYAVDAVHEFGFVSPGHPPCYRGREEVRRGYAAAWASPSVELHEIRPVAVHGRWPGTLVCEWAAVAGRRDATAFPLAGVLMLRAEDEQLVHVRDYMDVFSLALHTGRLAALAARYGSSDPSAGAPALTRPGAVRRQ